MMEYKGYTIVRITKNDWMVQDSEGIVVFTEDGKLTSKRLKDAKALIERSIK